MRRQKYSSYLTCHDGMFCLNYISIGNSIEFRVLEVEFWLLKWVDGRVVKRRRLKPEGRWPDGYSISADLIITLDGEDACFTLYGQAVDLIPSPYLDQVPIGGGIVPHDALTHATCQSVDGGNMISLRSIA